MANAPELAASLSLKTDKFAKQMKDAGLVADRGVRDIEDRFERSNPQLGARIAGGLLGGLTVGAFGAVFQFLDQLNDRFKGISDTAKLTGIAMQDVFAIQQALGASSSDAINKALDSVATLLDRTGRGEDNNLGKLLAVNGQDVKNVQDAAEAWNRVVTIIARAANEIQAREIGRSLGISPEVVELIRRAEGNYEKLFQTARNGAPDLKSLAALAEEFDAAWKKAVDAVKAYFLGGFHDLTATIAQFVETTARELRALESVGKAVADTFGFKGTGTIGGMAASLEGAAKNLRDGISKPLELTVNASKGPASKPIPLGGGGAAGRDTLDAFEREQRRITERTAALQEEVRLVGASAEKRAYTLEVLRLQQMAERENLTLTDEQRAKIEQQAAAYGKVVGQLEMARAAQQQFNELQQFAGNTLVDVLDRAVAGGEKFNDIMADVARSLARAALQAAILGNGPLAGLFGTTAAPGQTGGLIGQLFGLLPKFQTGGIVPGSGPVPIMAHGGERVIPKDAVARGAGGTVINLSLGTTNISAPGGDPGVISQLLAAHERRILAQVPVVVRNARGRGAI